MTTSSHPRRMPYLRNGPLGAFSLFSALPLSRGTADQPGPLVLRWFPLVGVVIGGLGFVPALVVWRGGPVGSPLLAAVLVVGALAVLTRALHLDGLSDLADGLGTRGSAALAREVMKRPDVGAFGAVAMIGNLFVQVASLATVFAVSSRPAGLVSVLVATVTGRVAVMCVSAFRAVPGGGLGTLVAGSIGPLGRCVAVGALVVAAELGALVTGGAAGQAVAGAAAVLLGIAVSGALAMHAVRRIDGVTGDVFGAVVETATATALLVLAAVTTWH